MTLAVFRADADAARGGGHVARCAALAQALRGCGWRTALATHAGSLEVTPFTAGSFDEIVSVGDDETGDMRQRWPDGCAFAVVDHYMRDARLEAALRPWARYILSIDDLGDRPHDCDLLLDVSLGRTVEDYAGLVPEHARLLIGPEFALLRPDFAAARATRAPQRGVLMRSRILIMFGATDFGGQSALAARALARAGLPIEVEIVVGPQAPSRAELRRIVDGAAVPMSLAIGATDIAHRMASSDIAIGAAGTSSWERCCVGLPSIVIILADNQVQIAQSLAARGAALVLGTAPYVVGAAVTDSVLSLIHDGDRLNAMRVAAAELCDGRGAERVADALIDELR
jgi:UDP-2,4-diacetamido-2,4,6-trideoxy-beta-L-altropyranose hydrolase